VLQIGPNGNEQVAAGQATVLDPGNLVVFQAGAHDIADATELQVCPGPLPRGATAWEYRRRATKSAPAGRTGWRQVAQMTMAIRWLKLTCSSTDSTRPRSLPKLLELVFVVRSASRSTWMVPSLGILLA
jgi:hypothetical protein